MKRVLLLAGGTVAFGVAVTRRRKMRRTGGAPAPTGSPHRAPAPRLRLTSLVWALAPFRLDMPDLPSIFLKFWNLGNLIWDQIASIVLSILEQAFALLVDILEEALHLVDETFERVWGAFDWVIPELTRMSRAMGNLIADTWNGVELAFANFRGQLQSWLENGYSVIKDFFLDQLPDLVRSVLGAGWDLLQEIADLGIDGLRTLVGFVGGIGGNGLALLMDFARDPIGFIWGLISGLVESAIEEAADRLGFAWEAFWGLFWPLLARQLGLPEDPRDMIDAARWLWTIALGFVTGQFEQAMNDAVSGAVSSVDDKIAAETRKNADLLLGLIYRAMGIEEDTTIRSAIRAV